MDMFHVFDNVFGGHDMITSDGDIVSSHDNILGGHDYYNNGELIGSTYENIFDGFDYFEGGEFELSTHDHGDLGIDVYDHQEGFIDSDVSQLLQMEVGISEGIYESGNFTTIMGYADPLAHVGNYVMPTLTL